MTAAERAAAVWSANERAQSALAGATALDSGGGGGDNSGMEARVAVLEQIAKSTEATLKEIKDDLRAVREKQERDFRLTFAAMIGLALGLAGLMAKGFRWL